MSSAGMVGSLLAAAAPLLLCSGCASTPEQDPVQVKLNDLDTRITRLEHIVANQLETAQRIDEAQAGIRELRGRLDELEHNSEALDKRERDLYADLDKRLSAAGVTAGGAAGAPGGAAASVAGAAAAGGAAATAGNTAGSGAAGSADAGQGGAPSSVEQAVYSQAFDALKAQSYSVAIAGFKDFLANYPTSPLADNAQYWLGEAHYVSHEYEAAAGAFRAVLRKWPDSRKAPDALLKLGYIQYAQKQYPAARTTLSEVTRKYPGSDAARLAAERLRRMPAPGAQ